MKEYFSLQFKITNRKFKDTGIEPWLAYSILTLGFFILSFYLFNKTEFAEYIYLLAVVTLISNLSETSRSQFLKLCFGDPKQGKIRVLENFICSFPFLIFLLYKQLFLSAALLLILTMVLALVNFRTTISFTIWTPFSKRPFEFTAGFRNTFYLIFIAYTLCLIALYVSNFNLGVFAMLLVFATTLSYYTNPENEYYIWMYSLSARQFLLSKIKTAILYSSALAFPLAIALAIFFSQNAGVLAIFLLIGMAFLTCMIVSKYSAYPDDMNITQGIILALCIGFQPLLIVLIPYLFLKSENRLSSLLK